MLEIIKKSICWFFNLPKCYDQERRTSKKYLAKLSICKNIWICSGLVIAILVQSPALFGYALILALLTTMIAFMILDETN